MSKFHDARAVLSVPTYITGFWGERQIRKVRYKNLGLLVKTDISPIQLKYRFGPVPAECAVGEFIHDERYRRELCSHLYLIINEEQLYFRHSFWPKFDIGAALDVRVSYHLHQRKQLITKKPLSDFETMHFRR